MAKRSQVAAIRLPDGSFHKPFVFSNDRQGFKRLLAQVASAPSTNGAGSPLFALEATGHYGHALQYYLVSQSAMVVGINPAHKKWVKEILDGSPEKSDRKDTMIIADLADQGRGRPVRLPAGVYAELWCLGKIRQQLANERTRYLNRYIGLVDLVFLELAALVPDVTRHTLCCLMAKFPTAVDVSHRQWRRIRRLLLKWSIGHFSEARCRRIYAAAKQSVGVREVLEAVRLQMRQVMFSLQSVEA